MRLRPLQAQALHDIGTCGGGFLPLDVGEGKCGRPDVEVFDPMKGRRVLSEVGRLRVLTQRQGALAFADAVSVQSGEKACLELKLKDGSSIGLSTDHPVLTHRGWVRCAELLPSDLVAVPARVPAPEVECQITDREVILCAYLLADGSLSQGQISFTNARLDCLDEITSLWPDHRIAKGRGCLTVHLRKTAEFRKRWGLLGLSKNKRVHESFWCLSDRHAALFLHRFFSCDGYYENGRTIGVTLASEKLIDDLRFLLLRLGIHSRKRFKLAKCAGKTFDAWRLAISGADALRFLDSVGPLYGRDASAFGSLRTSRRNTNTDIVPIGCKEISEIAEEIGISKTEARRAVWATPGQWISRDAFSRFCERYSYTGARAWLAAGDLRWEPVASLSPGAATKEPVYDLSVPGYGCFVGSGIVVHNTLVSVLASYVLDAQRPVLLLKASLIGKTRMEMSELARHWLVPKNIYLMSYQMLGLVQSADWLERVRKPDLIIADESQALKNPNAAVTRRIARYMANHPETKFVGMTGTIMRTSIKDFANVLRWALKERAPVPLDDNVLDEWSLALDEKIENEFERMEPGALLKLADPADLQRMDPIDAVRLGFRRRLRETPGVVCSDPKGTKVTYACATTGKHRDVRLEIRALKYPVSPVTEEHYRILREDKRTPDGYDIWEASEVWKYAREYALGFHQIWIPQPPEEWREARRKWFAFVRGVLARSRTWDSPHHVELACDAGKLPADLLTAWRAVKDTFTPNPVPTWHDDSALKTAAQWMREPGIVWVEHVPFGQKLSEMTGAKYYGADGLAADGEFIDHANAKRAVIASVKANREGRNLQRKWWRNLVTTPAEGADLWHQLIGRTHRPEQPSPVVTVDVFLGCAEHVRAWAKARSGAASIRQTVGSQNKLLIADIQWPNEEEVFSWSGPRWDRLPPARNK